MPCSKSLTHLFRYICVSLSFASVGCYAEPRLLFTGDILLSREVAKEISAKKQESPWQNSKISSHNPDWLMGNLEGSVGMFSECVKQDSLCFADDPKLIPLLKDAGFHALGVENNHSADLGNSGREKTKNVLLENHLQPMDFAQSPVFTKIHGFVFSFVTLTNVPGRDGKKITIPSEELAQKIRLAKSLSDWVVINIHWGNELEDWVTPKQKSMAKWLVEQGADVIIGHHPHVIQSPDCVEGKPVFYSLGNHLFDQKYPETKTGLIAQCDVAYHQLRCQGLKTHTASHSFFPRIEGADFVTLSQCQVNQRPPLIIAGITIRPFLQEGEYAKKSLILEGKKDGKRVWTTVARPLLAVEKGVFPSKNTEQEFLFTVENHLSPIDKETSPRPYVYHVTEHGIAAKWRGTALAWPLVDAQLMPSDTSHPAQDLCALHRKDSFIKLNSQEKETRTAVYEWNGFGFSGVHDEKLEQKCQALFYKLADRSTKAG